jgi:parallel beta-helix repeat protein
MVARNARAELTFPVIGGSHITDAAVAGVTVEGNRRRNDGPVRAGCRTSGIYLFECHDVAIRGCHVRDYSGDGISFQVSQRVTVETCVVERNAGLGLHPGSGSQHPVVRGNRSVRNQGHGLFVCWRVQHGLFENNVVLDNGGAGISIGHKDTDNTFRDNTIRGNRQAGIHFRKESPAMGAHRNTFAGNTVLDNDSAANNRKRQANIIIEGHHYDLVFRNNIIGYAESQPGLTIGMVTGPNARSLSATDSTFQNASVEIQQPGISISDQPSATTDVAPQ